MNRRTRRLIGTTAAVAALALARRFVSTSRPLRDFRGRTVLVTGGSRGLGLEVARAFARRGAQVMIAARDRHELVAARSLLADDGVEVQIAVADVTDAVGARHLIREVYDRFGRLDVLANVAGIIQVGPYDSLVPADYARAMSTHFGGPLALIREAVPRMRKDGGGRIVNVASIGGLVAVPHLLAYCASKFALVGLSRGLRSELAADGIVVTTVCPGLMRTGSPRHVSVVGQHEKEYAWFATAASMPLLTWSAPRAARRIVLACQRGEAQVILGLPAKILALLDALAPDLSAQILALSARLLPSAPAGDSAHKTGAESESALTLSPLLALNHRAERAENERPS
jgi:NAD(P)-dependent dehydrogenase (short-subunit alcohol dehydrogenase family)